MFDQIYCGDCLELMRELPDNSIDLICTDPPYCVGATSNGIKGSYTDFFMLKPFWEGVFGEWQRVLKDGSHIYVNTDWRTYPFLYPILQKYFVVRNCIVWDYELMKCGNYYRHRHEFIIFCSKGKTTRNFPASETDVWQLRTVPAAAKRKHPSEKPVELCERIIRNSTAPGDVVLDCFAGSGTTAVAAINLGRHFIGYELDENYFEVAQKRISEAIL